MGSRGEGGLEDEEVDQGGGGEVAARDRTQWRWSGDHGGIGLAVACGAVARAVKSSRAHLDLEVEDLGTAVARDADAGAPQLGQRRSSLSG